MVTNNYYAILRVILGGVLDKATDIKAIDTSGNEVTLYLKSNTNVLAIPVATNYFKPTLDYGIIFGDGTAEPARTDIYLSGNRILDYSVDATGFASSSIGNTTTVTATITLTNTGSAPITISEVAHVAMAHRGSTSTSNVMIDRVLLDNPVALAPSEQGVVVYRRSITI